MSEHDDKLKITDESTEADTTGEAAERPAVLQLKKNRVRNFRVRSDVRTARGCVHTMSPLCWEP